METSKQQNVKLTVVFFSFYSTYVSFIVLVKGHIVIKQEYLEFLRRL